MQKSVAVMLLVAAIFIDFFSQLLSIAADGMFICTALYLLYKEDKNGKSTSTD